MPKWLNAVIGAAEVAGGAALISTGAGGAAGVWLAAHGLTAAGVGASLLAMGIGTEISGIGQLLSKGPIEGTSTTERNPTAPREIGYGQYCSGGSLVYANYFGSNDKYLDMVFDINDAPSNAVTAVLFDKQAVQIDTVHDYRPGPPSTYPAINAGMSFSPAQQNDAVSSNSSVLIYYAFRDIGSSTVTVVTDGSSQSHNSHHGGDIPLLAPGDFVLVSQLPSGDGHVPGDSSMNGRAQILTVQHFTSGSPRYPTPSLPGAASQAGGTYVVFTYLAGGVPAAVVATSGSDVGYVGTLWPDYGSRIWVEVMLGKQLLGQTFNSLTVNGGAEYGTPNPSNPSNWIFGSSGNNAITYQNQNAGFPPWSNQCSLVGCTAVFLRLNYDKTQLSFIPQISFVIQGKNNIYDPRLGPFTGLGTASLSNSGSGYHVGDVLTLSGGATVTVTGIDGTTTGPITTWSVTTPGTGYVIGSVSTSTGGSGSGATFTALTLAGSTGTTGYTANWALCVADFLCDQIYGYKMGYGAPNGVNIPALITAANISDQPVNLAAGGTEPRYTCNGKYSSAQLRGAILKDLLSAGAGRITEQNGQYNIVAGNWAMTPVAAPALGTMGPVEWSTTPSISELYNGVKGTYIFPGNNWQPSDFPPYTQDSTHGYTLGSALGNDNPWTSGYTYAAGDYTVYLGIGYQSLQSSNTGHTPGASGSGSWWAQAYQDILMTADGGDRRWLDVQLPFTNSAATAQRLAKIELMRRRQLGTGVLRYNMFGYEFTALDVIEVTFKPWAAYGWTNKQLEILSSRFLPDPKGPTTEFSVQETDISIYDWSPATEELTPAGFVQPNIAASAAGPSPPTNVQLESDVTTAWIDPTGIARSRILVTWDALSTGAVINGGHIECQYQLVSSPPSPWISVPSVDPNSTYLDIIDVLDQDYYDVQVRVVDSNNTPSLWTEGTPLGSSSPGPIEVLGSSFLALGPPADVYYNISTDGDGNITASGISVTNGDSPPTPAMGVTAVIYDVFYVDMTAQATTQIPSVFIDTDTTMPYGGPLSIGYAAIGVGSPNCEIIYVVDPTGATVERGVLGTIAQDWSAIISTITAVDSLWNLEFNVATGLAIIPGMRARNSSPYTNAFVTEYNSSTGLVRLTAPLGNTPVTSGPGSSVTFYHQVSPLLSIERSIPAPSIGFFGGPNLADFNDTFPLPSAAVIYTQMKAHNNYSGNDQAGGPTVGSDSAWFPILFTPAPLFTHGGTLIIMNTGNSSVVPAGDTTDIFGPLTASETQDFGIISAAVANISGVSVPPIPTPVPVSDIRLIGQVPTGTIVLSGTVDSAALITVGVVISGIPTPRFRHGIQAYANDWVATDQGFNAWVAGNSYSIGDTIIDPVGHTQTVTTAGVSGLGAHPVWNDSGSTTTDGTGTLVWTDSGVTPLSDVATSLCNWLNSDNVFSSYYTCTVSGTTISIVDENNQGGVLIATSYGSGTFAIPSGLTSALGITVGSFYAIAYADTVDSFLGLTSAFVASSSTGPTGSYGTIFLGNIPTSPDARVDQINIYRGANGTPFGLNTPLYLVGNVPNTGDDSGTGFTSFSDTMIEATLITQAVYPGQSQPTQPNDLVLKIAKNGNPWFQMHVPPGSFSSNTVPGLTVRGLAQGSMQTVEVINNIGSLDVIVTEN